MWRSTSYIISQIQFQENPTLRELTPCRYLALVDRHNVTDCKICGCKIEHKVAEIEATSKCKHDPGICRDCLRMYVEGLISDGKWQSIRCPDQQCEETLTSRDVHKFVSAGVFKRYTQVFAQLSPLDWRDKTDRPNQRYNEDITLMALKKDPDYKQCFHCENGQIVTVGGTLPSPYCASLGSF